MKRPTRLLIASTALLMAQSALGAELLVNAFLESRPLQGLEIELDGRPVGTTGDRGDATAELAAGRHVLRVLKSGAELAEYSFALKEAQSADIAITFTDFESAPTITIDAFVPGEAAGPGDAGTIGGAIRDAAGSVVAGATIRIEEIDVEVQADDSGLFEIEVPRGKYTLTISAPGYQTVRKAGLRVVANVGTAANVTLPHQSTAISAPAGAEEEAAVMEEVVVTGTYNPTHNTTQLEEFSIAVTDAISIDELLRMGDSDIAVTLKRIVGVSITGGRYAVVRGLDGRYISSTLNGNQMPSTDPFRRDVQLDLFPSDILGGIEIQKSYSADLPGDTTGGIIKINTRGLPDEYVNSLSLSLGYTTGVTGEDIATYEGGDTDWLGIDDGLRELPGALRAASNDGLDLSYCQVEGQQNCVTVAEGAELASQLPVIYNPKTKRASPKSDLSYALGDLFELAGGTLGAYGTVSYGQSSESRQDAKVNDVYSNNGSGSSAFRTSEYVKDQAGTDINGYFVIGYRADGGWELLSKTTLLRATEDTATLESGINQEGSPLTKTTLEWVERQFLAEQLQGKHHFFGERHQLDWRVGVSQTGRHSPDRRSYNYLAGRLTDSTVERSYSDLTEDGLDLGLDYTLPVNLIDTVFTKFKLGVLGNVRKRDQELVRVGVRPGSNSSDVDRSLDLETLLSISNFENDVFRLTARSTATDSYEVDQDSAAVYVSTETNVGEAVTVVLGAREDDYTIDLKFPNAPNTDQVNFESNELLPAFAVIYRPAEAWQLRLGYSNTVSRPNITELAPSRFFDENDREFIGCPSCEASTIDNADFRVEYYFAEKDSVSLALFGKDIKKPLEVSIADASGGATNALTFRNNEGATLFGVELDVNKSFVHWADWSMGVGGNVSFIDSEIELDDVGQRLEIDDKRELQGQSPFLANIQLNVDHFPWDQKFTLLANYFDDRIDRVTRNTPSVYEVGRVSLNVNYEKGFEHGSAFKLKVRNLLDAKTEYEQGGQVIESYRKGVEVLLGYSMDF